MTMNPFEVPTTSYEPSSQNEYQGVFSTALLLMIPFLANLAMRFQIFSTQGISATVCALLLFICMNGTPQKKIVYAAHCCLITITVVILAFRFLTSRSCLFPRLEALELTNERLLFFIGWCVLCMIAIVTTQLLTKKR